MTAMIGLYLALASAALLLGAMTLANPKGSVRHRFPGWSYCAAMLGAALTGLLVTLEYGRFLPFLIFSLIVLVTVPAGVWAIWRVVVRQQRGLLEGHATAMVWSYAGLLLALGSQIGLTVMKLGLVSDRKMFTILVFVLLALGNVLASAVVPRQVRCMLASLSA
ncbi:DUF2306 domain-containing protein [Thermaurantiacus sp.]